MAGYSGTPLPQKLGIKPAARVLLDGAPAGFALALPDGARRVSSGRALDVIVLFAPSRARLDERFLARARQLAEHGGLWVAWPKKSAGVATDLTEGVVREIGLAAGLVDNKVCAIDETWSGLRFVVRLRDRTPKSQSAKREGTR